MKVPVSWLRDFVDLDLPLEELAYRLTMAGLEVGEVRYVGLPLPADANHGDFRRETKISGLGWEANKFVVAAVLEVRPHPNADRLVLCRLDDGQQEHTVLTGAPNLFPYKGTGPLERPLKVAYAREGARLYDGHQPGSVVTTLKRARIRGVDSYSMICSEKELGISEEHEGVILLDEQAPVGTALVDYMGDAVLDIEITPNMARNANILGVAREVAALTGAELRYPPRGGQMDGSSIEGRAAIEIRQPELNPRFVLGLIEGVEIKESPYEVQRRLRLAGMRPINNIVDATNYAMLEIGQPLHAFDYDVLVGRAGGESPTIITRTAEPGERLTTLDEVERELDDFTVLVCDTAGSLSIGGVMGGLESEVSTATRNILLEGAAWNFINIRRTVNAQRLPSEAAYRFSRGVHPSLAEYGVGRGLDLMRQWSGGTVSQGLVDSYPLPPEEATVVISPQDARRWLGMALSAAEMGEILERLEFEVRIGEGRVRATAPDHRLDIGQGVVGMADLMEEIARIYGYDRLPETRMADTLPPQTGNPTLEKEERLRDLLVKLGLQEVITYRLTTPENEGRRLSPGTLPDDRPYVRLANPITSERAVLRHSLLHSVLEIMERNARVREQVALFEIGPVFLASEEGPLPDEVSRLVIAMAGPRQPGTWQGADTAPVDFFDLKGILEALCAALRLEGVRYSAADHPSFHPGKCARLQLGERHLGVMGELHPLVQEAYELPETPILAADLDAGAILDSLPARFEVQEVPSYPPVLEDLAVVVEEAVPAERVLEVIRTAGGETVSSVRLFDLYRGEQIAPGKKSLAVSLTYQVPDRTLTDKEVAVIRQRIVRALEQELGASLRS